LKHEGALAKPTPAEGSHVFGNHTIETAGDRLLVLAGEYPYQLLEQRLVAGQW